MIREVEPPTPSSRISTSGTLPSLAAIRQTEPARLGRLVRGDLDWIVMKALAKERQRRYDSAIGLANDIERFTNHEPVAAGPPTAAYRLRKVSAEEPRPGDRGLAGAPGARGRRHRHDLGPVRGQRQRGSPRPGETRPRSGWSRRTRSTRSCCSIFRDLDPQGSDHESLPLPARLAPAARTWRRPSSAGDATDDPLGVARMQMTWRGPSSAWAIPTRAIDLCTKARATFAAHLGPDHPDTLRSMRLLAAGYLDARRFDRAVPALRGDAGPHESEARPRPPRYPQEHERPRPRYLQRSASSTARVSLYEEMLSLQKARLGPDHPDTLDTMNNLANTYQYAGRIDRALAALRGDPCPQEGQARPRPPRDARDDARSRPGLPVRRPARPRHSAPREDPGAEEVQARPRPPRHLPHHEQPRNHLPGCRPVRPRRTAPRGDRQAQEDHSRPRPPRHARQHGRPRHGLSKRGSTRPRHCRSCSKPYPSERRRPVPIGGFTRSS